MLEESKKVLEILDVEEIIIHFQPIVLIKEAKVIGFEALSRGKKNGKIISPRYLFNKAQKLGIKRELDRLCISQAFKEFKKIYQKNPEAILFLNFDCSEMDIKPGDAKCITDANQWNIPYENVVIEIAETEVKNFKNLIEVVNTYKDLGFLIALDDVGIEHSNLNRIPELKPDILKIDHSLIRDLYKEYHRYQVVKAIVYLGREIGSLTLAEGVEKEEEVFETTRLGIDFHQGFYFARPSRFNTEIFPFLEKLLNNLITQIHPELIKVLKHKKLKIGEWRKFVFQIVKDLRKTDSTRFKEVLKEWILRNEHLECLYVVDLNGFLITGKIFSPDFVPRKSPLFKPTFINQNLMLQEFIYPLVSELFVSYITEPYISLATGNTIITLSQIFKNFSGNKYILCADFKTDLL